MNWKSVVSPSSVTKLSLFSPGIDIQGPTQTATNCLKVHGKLVLADTYKPFAPSFLRKRQTC